MKAKVGHKINLSANIKVLNNDIGRDDEISIQFIYDTDDCMVRVNILNLAYTNIQLGYLVTNDIDLESVVSDYKIGIDSLITDILDQDTTSNTLDLKDNDIRSLHVKSILEDNIYKVTFIISYKSTHMTDRSVCYSVTKGDLIDIKSQLKDIKERSEAFLKFNHENDIEEISSAEIKANKITDALLAVLFAISCVLGGIGFYIMYSFMGMQTSILAFALIILMNLLFRYVVTIKRISSDTIK